MRGAGMRGRKRSVRERGGVGAAPGGRLPALRAARRQLRRLPPRRLPP